VATSTLGGCSAAAWKDRGHDFAQIFEGSFSFGPGVAASVRVTELAQIGAGSADVVSAGLKDGRFATDREQRSELGVSLIHTYEFRRDQTKQLLDVRHPYFVDPGYDEFPLSWEMESDRHDLDVGFNLHLFVGVDAACHLDELWDFVAGCFGFDPLHDDAYARPIAELQRQALSLDAARRDRAFDALLRRGEPVHGYAIYTASDVRPSYQRRAMEEVQEDLAEGR